MRIETLVMHHLVKGEDLNHHGTLFAGRGAEWLVEAGFIAASNVLPAKYLLCMKIHGMQFSRLITYIRAETKGELTVEGFITFVYVDDEGRSRPHGLTVEAVSEEEQELQRQASEL
mgnify:CR=1 FL=1